MAEHILKPKLEFNRPIQVDFALLDISKVHMYHFHYNVWMSKFPASTLLFTDTDSLCYAVDDADLTSRIGEISNEFDFSEFPVTHSLYIQRNEYEGRRKV